MSDPKVTGPIQNTEQLKAKTIAYLRDYNAALEHEHQANKHSSNTTLAQLRKATVMTNLRLLWANKEYSIMQAKPIKVKAYIKLTYAL